MSAPVSSFRPGIEVLLKHRGDDGNLTELDITPYATAEGAVVMTTKDLYAPAGEWSLSVPDMASDRFIRPPNARRDSLYGWAQPADVIEIRMARDASPNQPASMPVVMRGLVRSVGRSETIGGDGRPSRHVQIMGHDFGCVFAIQQLSYEWARAQGTPLSPIAAAISATGFIPRTMPANEFMRAAAHLADPILTKAGTRFAFVFDEKPGFVEPQTVQTIEGPLWSFMVRFSDAPWNELFVKEGKDYPQLWYRQTPWFDIDGTNLSDDAMNGIIPIVHTAHVHRDEIIALNSHRDDTDVATYIWIESALAQQNLLTWQASHPEIGLVVSPRNDPKIFGFRKMQVSSQQGPGMPSKDLPEAEQERSYQAMNEWLADRIQKLGRASINNADFEQGTIQLRGRSDIQVGDFVRVHRGRFNWRGYVTRVTHEWRAYQDFITTVNFIRSDQYFVRSRFDGSPWDAERASEDQTP